MTSTATKEIRSRVHENGLGKGDLLIRESNLEPDRVVRLEQGFVNGSETWTLKKKTEEKYPGKVLTCGAGGKELKKKSGYKW